MPFYQGKTDYGNVYLKNTDTYTSKVTKISKKNDIIMSVRAPVGPVNLNPFDEICIGRGLCAFRPKNKVDLEFIFNYLQTDGAVKGHMGSTYESISSNCDSISISFLQYIGFSILLLFNDFIQ